MKTLLLAIALLLPTAARAQATLLATAFCTGSGGPTTCTAPATGSFTISGSATLLIVMQFYNGGSLYTISDSLGNSFHDSGIVAEVGSQSVTLTYAYTPLTTGSDTVSCGTNFGGCFVEVWGGTVTGSGVFDATRQSNGGANCPLQNSSSITVSNELLISLFSQNGYLGLVTVPSVDSGFTLDNYTFQVAGLYTGGAIAYLNSATGTFNPTWSITGQTPQCQTGLVAFKLPPPGSTRHRASVINSQ